MSRNVPRPQRPRPKSKPSAEVKGHRCPKCGQAFTFFEDPPPPSYTERDLAFITEDECSCGGKGPNDPGACTACRIWHRLTALKEGKEST